MSEDHDQYYIPEPPDDEPLTVVSATFHEDLERGLLLVEIADKPSSDDEDAAAVWFSLDETQARIFAKSFANAVEELWGKSH